MQRSDVLAAAAAELPLDAAGGEGWSLYEFFMEGIPETPLGYTLAGMNLSFLLLGLIALAFFCLRARRHKPRWEEGLAFVRSRPVVSFDALGVACFVCFIMVMGALASGMEVEMEQMGTPAEKVDTSTLLLGIMLNGVIFLVFVFLLPAVRLQGLREAFGIRRETLRRDVLLGLVFFVIGFLIINLSSNLVEWGIERSGHTMDKAPQQVAKEIAAATNPVVIIAMLFVTCMIIPFAEECLFRGILFSFTLQTLGLVFAIVAVSIFFGIAHLVASVMVPLSLLGVVLAAGYVYSQSLTTPIVAHMLINLNSTVYLLMLGLPEVGVGTGGAG